MTEFEPQQPSGISRRTVTKAMAWAVPAIAIASPVPAFAASRGTLTFTGDNCKLPGDSSDPWKNGAVYIFNVTNTTANPITICITSVLRSNSAIPATNVTVIRLVGSGPHCTSIGQCFVVAPGGTQTYALVTSEWPSSANGDLIVNFTVDGTAATPATSESGTLSPITSNPSCAIGGSCSISTPYLQCVLRGLGQASCPTI